MRAQACECERYNMCNVNLFHRFFFLFLFHFLFLPAFTRALFVWILLTPDSFFLPARSSAPADAGVPGAGTPAAFSAWCFGRFRHVGHSLPPRLVVYCIDRKNVWKNSAPGLQKSILPPGWQYLKKTYPGSNFMHPGGIAHETALGFDWLGRWVTHKTKKNEDRYHLLLINSKNKLTEFYYPVNVNDMALSLSLFSPW